MGICGYFSKSKGFREQKVWKTLLQVLAKKMPRSSFVVTNVGADIQIVMLHRSNDLLSLLGPSFHILVYSRRDSSSKVPARMSLHILLILPISIKETYHQNIVQLFIQINARVGTLVVATIYLQLIQNRYMFRSFTVLQCSHQHCVQPVASDVEVVGYLQQRLLC